MERGAQLVLRFGERIGIETADAVISVSKKIKRFYYWKKISYIPNGVPSISNDREDTILEEYNLKEYVLFLGRLVPEKGVHTLIEAFKLLKRNIQLVIVGGTSHSDEYVDSLKKLSDTDARIIFTGAVFGARKISIMYHAKIFVQPSELEGMPITLLEAMGLNIPCLVSDIEEHMDIIDSPIGRLATTFSVGNSTDLAANLNKMLENDFEIKRISIKAHYYTEAKYSWADIAQQTASVYNQLVKL